MTTIHAPEGISDARTIHVSLYDTDHSGVVLERSEGVWVEYAYGDWDSYARRRASPLVAISAVMWPTDGAIGRRHISWDGRDEHELHQALRTNPAFSTSLAVAVGSSDAQRLLELLDARFERGIRSPLSVDPREHTTGLEFVKDSRRYWLWHTCNHETASWLREAGCRVEGDNPLGGFRIRID